MRQRTRPARACVIAATLLKMVAEHTLPADLFVSHTFDLDDIEEAYDVFGRAAQTQALKVALNA